MIQHLEQFNCKKDSDRAVLKTQKDWMTENLSQLCTQSWVKESLCVCISFR